MDYEEEKIREEDIELLQDKMKQILDCSMQRYCHEWVTVPKRGYVYGIMNFSPKNTEKIRNMLIFVILFVALLTLILAFFIISLEKSVPNISVHLGKSFNTFSSFIILASIISLLLPAAFFLTGVNIDKEGNL